MPCELCGIEGICFCKLFDRELVQKWIELRNEREESDAITLLESRGFEVWKKEGEVDKNIINEQS